MPEIHVPMGLRDVSERLEGRNLILTIRDPTALVQTIGWLKYISKSNVFYRGQTRIYDDMIASGFRGLGQSGRESLSSKLRDHVDALYGAKCVCNEGSHFPFGQSHRCMEKVKSSIHSQLVLGTHRAAIEPLLQHYGLKTRWIDVVDNIWIALWFATHVQVSKGRFAYHQRMSESLSGQHTYIAVLKSGALKSTGIPGYSIGDETRLVDLRYAVPSNYVRPHAQHGLLVAPKDLSSGKSGSLKANVLAYLEIDVLDALSWLGSGLMTSSYVLFPPAVRDEGYRCLIDSLSSTPPGLGEIVLYGPGS